MHTVACAEIGSEDLIRCVDKQTRWCTYSAQKQDNGDFAKGKLHTDDIHILKMDVIDI